jgi:putative salt-induced outer membrane protein YdiY
MASTLGLLAILPYVENKAVKRQINTDYANHGPWTGPQNTMYLSKSGKTPLSRDSTTGLADGCPVSGRRRRQHGSAPMVYA